MFYQKDTHGNASNDIIAFDELEAAYLFSDYFPLIYTDPN